MNMNKISNRTVVLSDQEFELLRINFLLIISEKKVYVRKLLSNPERDISRISFHQNELDELIKLFNEIFRPDHEK